MELTNEQYDIIQSTGDIKINAVAGSGKTTTIIEYAKSRPPASKILYLAFNKSVKLEALRRFAALGLTNVKVETAHSLAYRHIVFQHGYKVRPQAYKTSEIAALLNLKGNEEKHTEYVIANHINKFMTYFCNSNKEKVQDLNYLDTVTDPKAKTFVNSFYPYIVQQTRLLLGKMDKGEIEIIHDFYLKKFQLSNPILPYDYILFDEGQDASPAMLDVFFKQKATKVIVGDTHQQIYGWRFAVNSLEKANFKTYHLSTSFRFKQEIADLAMAVLDWKKYLVKDAGVTIKGAGQTSEIKSRAVLGRTNLGLLLKAIEYVSEKKKVKHIYFEGNIHSYTYADEGASLYDVLHLYNHRTHLIRDKLIKSMKSLYELEDYIEKTEDVQLAMMVTIVREYGNEIPGLLNEIKEKHVANDEKDKAEMIFSTVHRCKGMEYDAVQLVNDFITQEKLEKGKDDKHAKQPDPAKLNEEINLLYVAITRTKNSLHIPETLMPADYPKTNQIFVTKVEDKSEALPKNAPLKLKPKRPAEVNKEKAYSVERVRTTHQEAYKPWTEELDSELTVMFCEGMNLKDMAKQFGRTPGAITTRIKKLQLWELYG